MSSSTVELSFDQFLSDVFGVKLTRISEEKLKGKLQETYFKIRDEANKNVPIEKQKKVNVTWKELYKYFSKYLESAISTDWVSKLSKILDKDKDGNISEDEFVTILSTPANLEEEVSSMPVPRLYVIPGSSRLNALSKTNSFNTQVISRANVQDLVQVWSQLDENRDGRVELAEFKNYLSRTVPHLRYMGASLFNALDRTRKGTVTFKRLLKALYPEATEKDILILLAMAQMDPSSHAGGIGRGSMGVSSGGGKGASNESLMAEVEMIFKVYDDNLSGGLDEEEFASALQLAGFDEQEAVSLFKKVDVDESGMVSFEEFRDWYLAYYHSTGGNGGGGGGGGDTDINDRIDDDYLNR
eukprot:CAMPEP_0175057084 /NCGR_PEP_ID=MMETSP0052_2-20121109/11058_1 /TAXON_ID=51329 ORGANISM="Polytomella parva, Strain SAG 63-3" /NCGR_SAMPLE_ID=MMETSP0052_2 /ASSEMBLY_ACC=CAM_ASM_000194 /LENGTH=355 /DNA_ID=CAMNT_0016322239 /DNA_START=64 /DNA_END=1132 /DNA_ORIENTATION=+